MLFGIWLVFKTVRSPYTTWSYFRCDIRRGCIFAALTSEQNATEK
jgi:hypothetical protein